MSRGAAVYNLSGIGQRYGVLNKIMADTVNSKADLRSAFISLRSPNEQLLEVAADLHRLHCQVRKLRNAPARVMSWEFYQAVEAVALACEAVTTKIRDQSKLIRVSDGEMDAVSCLVTGDLGKIDLGAMVKRQIDLIDSVIPALNIELSHIADGKSAMSRLSPTDRLRLQLSPRMHNLRTNWTGSYIVAKYTTKPKTKLVEKVVIEPVVEPVVEGSPPDLSDSEFGALEMADGFVFTNVGPSPADTFDFDDASEVPAVPAPQPIRKRLSLRLPHFSVATRRSKAPLEESRPKPTPRGADAIDIYLSQSNTGLEDQGYLLLKLMLLADKQLTREERRSFVTPVRNSILRSFVLFLLYCEETQILARTPAAELLAERKAYFYTGGSRYGITSLDPCGVKMRGVFSRDIAQFISDFYGQTHVELKRAIIAGRVPAEAERLLSIAILAHKDDFEPSDQDILNSTVGSALPTVLDWVFPVHARVQELDGPYHSESHRTFFAVNLADYVRKLDTLVFEEDLRASMLQLAEHGPPVLDEVAGSAVPDNVLAWDLARFASSVSPDQPAALVTIRPTALKSMLLGRAFNRAFKGYSGDNSPDSVEDYIVRLVRDLNSRRAKPLDLKVYKVKADVTELWQVQEIITDVRASITDKILTKKYGCTETLDGEEYTGHRS